MHRFSAPAFMMVAFLAGLSCRKQQSKETGGVTDSAGTPPAATAPVTETPETTSTRTEFGFDQRQNFVQSIRQQLAGIDQQIKDLSAQAKSRGGAVSDRALARIRTQRQAVDRSLTRANSATAANWDQLKQGVTQAVDNLSESIEAAQPK
jgi:small-conductance mechanosensitive channel